MVSVDSRQFSNRALTRPAIAEYSAGGISASILSVAGSEDAHPPEYQCHLEYEVRCEDDQEVHRCVLNNGPKDPWHLVALDPGLGRDENNYQKNRSVCR